MTKQDKQELIKRYINAYNDFDIDGMIATVHPEIEFKNISVGETTATASGAEEFRHMAEQSTALFASREQSITNLIADGQGITVDIEYKAVLASDLPNGVKGGETLRLTGRFEFRFRDGKISSIIDYS